jgi:hypothetical protein
MPGSTIQTPFGLQSGGSAGGAAGAGGADTIGPLKEVISQTNAQTEQFSGLLKDPNFTGQSEMGEMLKLQRAVAQETMMYQAVSNIEKAFTDSKKNAISNFK